MEENMRETAMEGSPPVLGIEAVALAKSYGPRRAVRGIDLRLPSGRTLALLGPNGAGKTTTIRMLSCLLRPSSGRALVLGRDIAAEAGAVKRLIGVSPQETAVAPRLSVMENICLIAGAYGLDRPASRSRAEELMELFSLADRSRDRASSLSGGLARRLSIAMALAADPPVLFLDEPTLGLDPEARSELRLLIAELKKEKTILLTTHYLEEADVLADRIAVIAEGRIEAEGSPEDIKRLAPGGSGTLEQAYLSIVRKGASK
jgi:ABC-2 type transport system ATP-binding protein